MKRIVPLSLLLGLVALLASGVAPVWAAPCGGPPTSVTCQCGDTVVDDYEFPANLTCGGIGVPANGLTVVGGVDVNLKGFKLTGTSKRGIGLLLQGSGGSLQNGRIQGFNVGIKSDGPISSWQIGFVLPLQVINNQSGLNLVADLTTLADTTADSNLNDGVRLKGSQNTIEGITCSKNGGRGLFVEGVDNLLNSNRCERNGRDGLSVLGSDNALIRNLASGNGDKGVAANGARNSFQRNQGRNNHGDGVRGIGLDLSTDGHNFGSGNSGANCLIDGHPSTGGGRYC